MAKTIAIITAATLVIIGVFYVSNKKSMNSSFPGDVSLSPQESMAEITTAPSSGQPLLVTPQPTIRDIALSVTSPKDGEVVSSASVIVKGTTVPNADVFVNEKDAKADAKGNFSVPILMDEGDNYIVVTVTDMDGNQAEQDIAVIYEVQQ